MTFPVPTRPALRGSLVALCGLAVAACEFRFGEGGSSGSEKKAETLEATRVRVVPVTRGEIASYLETTATVESDAMVDVYPRAAGVVVSIEAEEGDRVEKDAVLANLDEEEAVLEERNAAVTHEEAVHKEGVAALAVEEARSREAQMRTTADQAKRDHDRTRSMAVPGEEGRPAILAEKDLEAAKLAWDKAEWDFEAAKFAAKRAVADKETARVAAEKAKIAWELEKVRLAERKVRAPFAGVVATRHVKVGETVGLQTKAFTLADSSHLLLRLHRPQRELSFLRPDLPAEASAEALPGRDFRGRLVRVSPTVDPASGNVRVTIEIEGEEQGLRPGMLVRVKVTTDRRSEAVLVPKKAVLYEGTQPVVFAVRDGKAARVPLEEGYSDHERMEVRNVGEDGLRPDDLVVVAGAADLRDGASVEVVEG